MQNYTIYVPNSQQVYADSATSPAQVVGSFLPKRLDGNLLARSFSRLYHRYGGSFLEYRAIHTYYCSHNLRFSVPVDLTQGKPRLVHADFCRVRLCPLCEKRRSLQFAGQLTLILDELQSRQPDVQLIFLTLTIRDVCGRDLPGAIDILQQGFRRMTRNYRRKLKAVIGGFRSLEITAKQNGQFHPHLHCILAVDGSYFNATRDGFIHKSEWRAMWQSSIRSDYGPIVDIEAVKDKEGDAHFFSSAVAEVSKYSTKSADYIVDDEKETDRRVYILAHALHGRKLYNMWGVVRKLHGELNLSDPEKLEDIGHSDGVYARDDVLRYLGGYRWWGDHYEEVCKSQKLMTHDEWCAYFRDRVAKLKPQHNMVCHDLQKNNFRASLEKAKKKMQKRPAFV